MLRSQQLQDYALKRAKNLTRRICLSFNVRKIQKGLDAPKNQMEENTQHQNKSFRDSENENKGIHYVKDLKKKRLGSIEEVDSEPNSK